MCAATCDCKPYDSQYASQGPRIKLWQRGPINRWLFEPRIYGCVPHQEMLLHLARFTTTQCWNWSGQPGCGSAIRSLPRKVTNLIMVLHFFDGQHVLLESDVAYPIDHADNPRNMTEKMSSCDPWSGFFCWLSRSRGLLLLNLWSRHWRHPVPTSLVNRLIWLIFIELWMDRYMPYYNLLNLFVYGNCRKTKDSLKTFDNCHTFWN